jgi:hypothetical protein
LFNKGSSGVRLVDDFSKERSIDGSPVLRAVVQARHVPHVHELPIVLEQGDCALSADVNAENCHVAALIGLNMAKDRLSLRK